MAVTELLDPVSSSAPAAIGGGPEGDAARPEALPSMPASRLLLLLLGMMVGGLLLLAAAVVSTDVSERTPRTASVPSTVETPTGTPEGTGAIDTPDTEQSAADQIPAFFPAEPRPVPQELITDIEAASGEPLPVELGRLLGAIQEGFGSESVQLAPELRAYAFRMASRFDWNPDTFRVAVTAPTPDLAAARATMLRRLFESATGADRLQIRSGTGPHSLTLVSDS